MNRRWRTRSGIVAGAPESDSCGFRFGNHLRSCLYNVALQRRPTQEAPLPDARGGVGGRGRPSAAVAVLRLRRRGGRRDGGTCSTAGTSSTATRRPGDAAAAVRRLLRPGHRRVRPRLRGTRRQLPLDQLLPADVAGGRRCGVVPDPAAVGVGRVGQAPGRPRVPSGLGLRHHGCRADDRPRTASLFARPSAKVAQLPGPNEGQHTDHDAGAEQRHHPGNPQETNRSDATASPVSSPDYADPGSGAGAARAQ